MPALLGGTGIIGKDIFVKMKAQKSASIQTASGTVVTFPQSEERAFSGLNVYGHSTQSGTPSPDNPVPIVSAGDSGEINVTVGGAQLIQSENPISNRDIVVGDLQAGTYTLSFLSNSDWWTGNSNKSNLFLENDDKDIVITMQNTVVGERCYGTFAIETAKNDAIIHTYDNNTISAISEIMLNSGSTALPYEPYKTPQTLTLSTPGGLPGIPVTSGGNYTDESGQQWIADVKDYGTGKYTQNIGQIASYNGEDVGDVWMSSTGQLTTGANVIYQLATPIVTDLPAEEIAAYKALHTYSPATTVGNDADAWMKVGYNEFNKRTF